MKNVILLILFLMTSLLGNCQIGSTSYPKKLELQGDTIIAITPLQAKIALKTKITLGEYKELSDSLYRMNNIGSLLIENLRYTIDSQEKEKSLLYLSIDNRDKEIDIQRRQCEELEKSLKAAKRKDKILGGGVIASVAAIVVLLIAK